MSCNQLWEKGGRPASARGQAAWCKGLKEKPKITGEIINLIKMVIASFQLLCRETELWCWDLVRDLYTSNSKKFGSEGGFFSLCNCCSDTSEAKTCILLQKKKKLKFYTLPALWTTRSATKFVALLLIPSPFPWATHLLKSLFQHYTSTSVSLAIPWALLPA